MKKGLGVGTFAVVVLSFALSGLIVEVVLRATHLLGARISWSVPDPQIGWRYKPNTDYWYDSRENIRPTVGRTNRHSWNDTDWVATKEPGTYRIAVLGDSYVEALQVEQEKNFTNLAQVNLNQPGTLPVQTFELMNFGRSGFTQTEELIVLKNEVLDFDPDLVVVFFYAPNDIMDVHPDTANDRMRPFPVFTADGELMLDTRFNQSGTYRTKSQLSPLKNNSAFLSLIAERLQLYLAMRALRKLDGTLQVNGDMGDRIAASYLSLGTQTPNPAFSRSYAINKSLIRAMRHLCSKHGVAFLLVAIDTPAYEPAVEGRLKSAAPDLRTDFFSTDLATFAEDIGADFLDLQKVFRNHYRVNGVSLHFTPRGALSTDTVAFDLGHAGHWNYTGHEVVADALAARIRAIKSNAP